MRIEEKNGQISVADFNEFQAYKIACKVEQDGVGIYNYLNRRVEEPALRDMFAFLSQQEEEHYRYFKKRVDDLVRENRKEKNEKYDNLINLMELKIFPSYQDIIKLAESVDNEKDLLVMAIDIESKSISFYEACRENIDSPDIKKELEHIIEEENHHKELLQEASKQS